MSVPFRERNPVIVGAVSLAVIFAMVMAAFRAEDRPAGEVIDASAIRESLAGSLEKFKHPDADALQTPAGHVAVGWLLVEDLFTVPAELVTDVTAHEAAVLLDDLAVRLGLAAFHEHIP